MLCVFTSTNKALLSLLTPKTNNNKHWFPKEWVRKWFKPNMTFYGPLIAIFCPRQTLSVNLDRTSNIPFVCSMWEDRIFREEFNGQGTKCVFSHISLFQLTQLPSLFQSYICWSLLGCKKQHLFSHFPLSLWPTGSSCIWINSIMHEEEYNKSAFGAPPRNVKPTPLHRGRCFSILAPFQ